MAPSRRYSLTAAGETGERPTMPARRASGTLAETACAPPARDSRSSGASSRRGLQTSLYAINHLLTITPQHCPSVESRHGLWSEALLIVHLGGGLRLAGLQGVTSCRHLAYDTRQVCFPNSSWRFSARLVWVSRLRLRSSGFVPDRHARCYLTALGCEGRGGLRPMKRPQSPRTASQIAGAISPTLISLARYTHASSANTLPSAMPTASLPRLTRRMLTS